LDDETKIYFNLTTSCWYKLLKIILFSEERQPKRVQGVPVGEPIEGEHRNLDDGIIPERVQDILMEERVEVEHQNLNDGIVLFCTPVT
jgi:hypothetical protein